MRYALPKREPLAVEQERFRDAIAGNDGAGIVTMAEGVHTLTVIEATPWGQDHR